MDVSAYQAKGRAIHVIQVAMDEIGEDSLILISSVSGQQFKVRCHTVLPHWQPHPAQTEQKIRKK